MIQALLDCVARYKFTYVCIIALSTLATIVADFGDCRRIRRRIATVASLDRAYVSMYVWLQLLQLLQLL